MKAAMRVIYAASLLLVGTIPVADAVCFVDVRATGSNNGASWRDAYADLQLALKNLACKEVWVAKGVYKPAPDIDRAASFNVNPGVAVYGGFAGEEATRSARNPKSNLTVLSGDIGGDDANAAGDQIDRTSADIHGDNSYHVVRMDGASGAPILADTLLDGFTITGGNADGTAYPDYDGSGLYCNGSGSGHECSPTLSNLVFSGNEGHYGALFNDAFDGGTSNPTLAYLLFSGNFADKRGGAIYDDAMFGGVSSPNLANVVFDSNDSGFGGAMYNDGSFGGDSSPQLNQASFINSDGDDTGAKDGGAMYNNGSSGGNSSPVLYQVTFSENGGKGTERGGAMYNNGANSGHSNPKLTAVTFRSNRASYGGAIFNDATAGGESSPELVDVTFQGNKSVFGGALHTDVSDLGASNPSLTNVTFSENTEF